MKHTLVSLTAAKAGQEAEFKQWYSDTHVKEVLAIPGISNARVSKVGAAFGYMPWQQVAMFDLDFANPEDALGEIQARIKNGKIGLHPSVEMTAVSLFTFETP
ncbi:hypothetical protein SH591_11405 [Sphingomonas sp. LY54]|uniref:hypothetical protein n=1 Tax=Sphingomonadales TaxID=204457 RepID=UPI002ADEBED2|nr:MULTISPECIES: hypothetical protein [Sphingomonadales]MEA1015261.1 hypothetical protein [Sphingosinicella sp. LY1275]WRP27710.1 hypothetical protein SH591_11405 [Sphingomonas sp. LY54]